MPLAVRRVGRGRSTALAAVAVSLLAFTGCTAVPPPTSPPPSVDIPSPSDSVTQSASPTPPAATTDYTGPSPMPATDGGPMLWPTAVERTVRSAGGWSETGLVRVGFVDATGELVVPPRYDGYDYCRDANGRATLVLATSAEDHVDVLDLTGDVVTQIPGRLASCAGDSYAVFQTEAGEYDPATFGEGLFDLRAGEVVLPVKVGRVILPLNKQTMNVRDADGEYFLDPDSGRKTPHPGYLWYPAYASEPPWPAAANSDGEVFGYLDESGRWALKPTFAGAEPFQAGHAVVRDGTASHVIDTHFRQVGEKWDTIDAVGSFYQVTRKVDGAVVTGILDADLTTVFDPAPGEFTCYADDEQGTCLITSETAAPRLLRLPEAGAVELPWQFSNLLSRTFVEDRGDSDYATHVLNVGTGITFALAMPGDCVALSDDWVGCHPLSDLPMEVYTASGRRTAFRDLRPLPNATDDGDAPYYWVVAGSHRGFVDVTGRWLYRESSYTDLED